MGDRHRRTPRRPGRHGAEPGGEREREGDEEREVRRAPGPARQGPAGAGPHGPPREQTPARDGVHPVAHLPSSPPPSIAGGTLAGRRRRPARSEHGRRADTSREAGGTPVGEVPARVPFVGQSVATDGRRTGARGARRTPPPPPGPRRSRRSPPSRPPRRRAGWRGRGRRSRAAAS